MLYQLSWQKRTFGVWSKEFYIVGNLESVMSAYHAVINEEKNPLTKDLNIKIRASVVQIGKSEPIYTWNSES
jgi:hypothetical protein